jgi:hypothetical protein
MRNRDYRELRRMHRDKHHLRHSELHPRISAGIFFIVLGLALLVATNDLLSFGGIGSYFTWETAMIFIGVIMLLNLKFTPGLLLIAGGIWFLQDRIFLTTPELFKNFYWPGVIVVVGLGFILSSFLKRKS